MKKSILSLVMVTFLLLSCNQQVENKEVENTAETSKNQDPLPSWNDSKSKKDIIAFVTIITDSTNANYVKPEDRIITFDNDGTLWSEQPAYFQLFFALDRIKSMAADYPEWQKDKILKAAIDGDMKTMASEGEHGLLKVVMTTHAGMTTDEFEQIVKDWIATAKHPVTGKLIKDMIYQPMLEVINYLKANQCKVFIVSGGGIEFMRPWTQEVYGIPAEQVVGSSVKTKFEIIDAKATITRLPEIDFIDDKEGKPVAINKHIGKKPIASFGNSDGDLAMLQWTASGDKARLLVYIHHTDAEREYAYDRESSIGHFDVGLDEAKAKNWTIVDMKTDWNQIYPSK
jgi:phosphoserine phosphatase